jgi:hypothetical protein
MHGAQNGVGENYAIPCNIAGEAGGRKMRVRIPSTLIRLSSGSVSSIPEYEIDVEDDADNVNIDYNGVKHMYWDESWSKNNFTYDPPRMVFLVGKVQGRLFIKCQLCWPCGSYFGHSIY